MFGKLRHHRMRTNFLLVLIIFLGVYMMLFETSRHSHSKHHHLNLDPAAIERRIKNSKKVEFVTYKPSEIQGDVDRRKVKVEENKGEGKNVGYDAKREMKYHKIWAWADHAINRHELYPDTPDVDEVLKALKEARIVHVDTLDIGDYESGTSEKWVIILEGGQKAMMKLVWHSHLGENFTADVKSGEKNDQMKKGAMCNYGYEMANAEIAAFHLHRILGFRNTPYVTGRKVDLRREIFPVASPSVSKQLSIRNPGNETCVTGKCFFCKTSSTACPKDGIIDTSISYWIPRHLKLHTYPPKYMPFSTPNMDQWGDLGFNNRTYCKKVRKMKPYDQAYYYDDLMDFGVLDTIMYHYDSKHYTIDDQSDAQGLTIRLDHGRAFCAYDRDDYEVFLAPVFQCCRLRWSTWNNIQAYRGAQLTQRLKDEFSKDPLAPLLNEVWYPVLERRLEHIIETLEKCAKENGGHHHIFVG